MPWHRLINSNARPRDDYLPKNEKRVEPSESVCGGGRGRFYLAILAENLTIFLSGVGTDYTHPATWVFRSSNGSGQRGYFTEPVSNLVL